MNSILFGLTSYEKELLGRSTLDRRAWYQLSRASSTIAPASLSRNLKKSSYQSKLTPLNFSYQPPRYFSRGALEKDKRNKQPDDFFLLMETNEKPRARFLPPNRTLLRSLCRGKGNLRQNEKGHVYLDVDNQFILALLPYLIAQGLSRPPYFNLFSTPLGAHIPVIPARESNFKDIGSIKELNWVYTFEIEGMYSVEPNSWPEVEQIWYFKVICPELEALRRKYFLPARPGGHSFVIATAVKPARPPAKALPTFRISPSAYAA